MNGILDRTLGILELLVSHVEGLPLATIADHINTPRSAVHRLLTDLVRHGYVRQVRDQGDYVLTTKLVSMGLSFLSNSGIIDLAQPLLDRLARASGELVRLSVIDGERLTWVARAQGATRGLRYDPDMGQDATFSCSASGWAWLSTLSDEQALEMVARQGFGSRDAFGPNAPSSVSQMLEALSLTRARGFAITIETFTQGMTAMAAPVRSPGQPAIGCISVAGPAFRFTEQRMLALGDELMAVAHELASISGSSPLFYAAPRDARHAIVST